jgi:hypothetical protein
MLNNFFSRMYNKISSSVSNAVGKFHQFGSAVGKHLSTAVSVITPEATGNANLSGLSATMLKITKASYKTDRAENIDGYIYDKDLSNNNTAVYHNDNNVIIGFRGTVNIDDLITDVSVIKGTADDIRFKQAVETYNKVKNKYPNLRIMATGHSLGGSLALYLNSLYNIPVETFNAGMGLGFLKSNPNSANVLMHVIKGDVISGLAGLSNLGTLKVYNPVNPNATTREKHSIKNFSYV